MKRNISFVIAFFLLLVLPALPLAAINDYLVGAGDVLRVNVYDHPDLSTTVRVNSDGNIIFPLVGSIGVSGISVSRVAETIAVALSDGYIVNPQVSVFVEEFRSRKAIIMGQVKNPGMYELSGPSTLLELISKAGGLSVGAGETVSIKRKPIPTALDEQLITVNLKNLTEKGDSSQDMPILDGDNVFVSEAGTIYVTGQVSRPNAYKVEKETSVIKAITMAGGFTDLAAKGRVKIIRKIEGAEKVLENVPMHALVQPEDVIVVPESFF